MKYLKTYNQLYEFFDTFTEHYSELSELLPNDIDIYNEISIIKSKDRDKSIIYNIVRNNFDFQEQQIIAFIMKFTSKYFPDIINKYKLDHKIKKKERKEPKHDIEIPIKGSNKTLTVPSRIGHNYTPFEALPLSDLEKYKEHRRLKTFYYKGTECVNPYCDRKGIYLIKAYDRYKKIHVDVYTKDFILMTVDHILPKSKGGTYDLKNLDPMCSKCNSRKGNIIDYKFEK